MKKRLTFQALALLLLMGAFAPLRGQAEETFLGRLRARITGKPRPGTGASSDPRFHGTPLPKEQADLLFSLVKPLKEDRVFYKWLSERTPREMLVEGPFQDSTLRNALRADKRGSGLYISENPFSSTLFGATEKQSELVEIHIPKGSLYLDFKDKETMAKLEAAGLTGNQIMASHPKLLIGYTGDEVVPYWLMKDNKGITFRHFRPENLSNGALLKLMTEWGSEIASVREKGRKDAAIERAVAKLLVVLKERKNDLDPTLLAAIFPDEAEFKIRNSEKFDDFLTSLRAGAGDADAARKNTIRYLAHAGNGAELLREATNRFAELKDPEFRRGLIELYSFYANSRDPGIAGLGEDVREVWRDLVPKFLADPDPKIRQTAAELIDGRYRQSVRSPGFFNFGPEAGQALEAAAKEEGTDTARLIEAIAFSYNSASPHAEGIRIGLRKIGTEHKHPAIRQRAMEQLAESFGGDDGAQVRFAIELLLSESETDIASGHKTLRICMLGPLCRFALVNEIPSVPRQLLEDYLRRYVHVDTIAGPYSTRFIKPETRAYLQKIIDEKWPGISEEVRANLALMLHDPGKAPRFLSAEPPEERKPIDTRMQEEIDPTKRRAYNQSSRVLAKGRADYRKRCREGYQSFSDKWRDPD